MFPVFVYNSLIFLRNLFRKSKLFHLYYFEMSGITDTQNYSGFIGLENTILIGIDNANLVLKKKSLKM